jgi:hypothetical protein
VPEIELREDREVIVKVRPNREQIQGLPLMERVERQRAIVARQYSTALAGRATFVAARKQHLSDVVMVANSAARAELLRKHAGWLKAFKLGTMVRTGVVAYENFSLLQGK